jgi:hypothetical protein
MKQKLDSEALTDAGVTVGSDGVHVICYEDSDDDNLSVAHASTTCGK